MFKPERKNKLCIHYLTCLLSTSPTSSFRYPEPVLSTCPAYLPTGDHTDSSFNLRSYSKPTRCTCYLKLFILVKRSTCFGRSFRPLSGAQNCVYSNRYISNSYCYLLLSGMILRRTDLRILNFNSCLITHTVNHLYNKHNISSAQYTYEYFSVYFGSVPVCR